MPNSAKIPSIRLSPGFILIWILCDPTDFGQFSSNEKCEESRQIPGNEKSFTIHINIKLCSCSQHPGSLLCPCGTIYSYSELYTHKQMYIDRYRCTTYKMYKEAENDLAVKFTHISSQYKTQSWFFSFAFPKALNTSPATQSPGWGKCWSSPFLNSWYFKHTRKAGKKLQEEQKKEDEVNSKINSRPAKHTACPGVECIRSENKVRRVCQLEMGKLCNYLNMSMPACSKRRLGTWIHFYTC